MSKDKTNGSIFLFCVVIALCAGCQNAKTASVQHPDVLTIAHEGPVLSLDPQANNDSVTWSFLGNIYEPLVTFDRDMKIVAALAERWENPNDLTWRFYLRKNVRFQNGRPFTAADVVFTIKRGLLDVNRGTKPYLISVKSAKAVDEYTVDIFTDQPNPVLLNKLTFIDIMPASSSLDSTVTQAVGTGPYRFARKIGTRTYCLEANESYWRGSPVVKKVNFLYYDSDELLVQALLDGKAQLIRDFAEHFGPKIQASKIAELLTHDALGVTFVGFNLVGTPKDNPMLNLDVRKAVYSAFDYDALVRDALEGRGTVARQLVSPTIFGYNPDFHPMTGGRDQVVSLLAAAGFPKGLQTEIYGYDEIRVKTLAAQLQKAGILAQPRVLTWTDLNARMSAHQLPIYTLSWACSYGDAGDFLENCVHTAVPGTGYGGYNMAGYSNPEVDRLIEESGQTLKVDERKTLLQQALSIVMNDLPYIPIYSRDRGYGLWKELDWQPRRDGRLYAFDIRWKSNQ